MRARPGQAFEIGQRVECEIHFSRRTTEFVTLHLFHEIARQLIRSHHFEKRKMGIDAGGNHLPVEFIARFGSHAGGPAIF